MRIEIGYLYLRKKVEFFKVYVDYRNKLKVYHRLDGPAEIWYNGWKHWYVDGDHKKTDMPK